MKKFDALRRIDAISRSQNFTNQAKPRWQHGIKHLQSFEVERFVSDAFHIFEDDNVTPIKTYKNGFSNWGKTVSFRPAVIFQPTTVGGVQNIVNWARSQGKRVRVIGYHHSWTNLFGEDGTVLITLFSLDVAIDLPAQHPHYDPKIYFEAINCNERFENGEWYGFVKVGAGVTNYQFVEWTTEEDKKNHFSYYFPMNVVMTEINIAGSNAPMCHGSGINNPTLSDLVEEIEFIDANGGRQSINRVTHPEQMRAAAGCFGLLGVVISLTFKLKRMQYTSMNPAKVPVAETIPPPLGYKLPPGMRSPHNADQLWKKFIHTASTASYSEWFWFASHDDCWVNCWTSHPERPKDVEYYPSRFDSWLQEKEVELGNVIYNSNLMGALPYRAVAEIFSKFIFLFDCFLFF
jgi:hypothetical protein